MKPMSLSPVLRLAIRLLRSLRGLLDKGRQASDGEEKKYGSVDTQAAHSPAGSA